LYASKRGAPYIPSAMSFSTCFSSVSVASARLSCPFSFCRSLSFLALQLQSTEFPAPAVVGLIDDACFFTGQWDRLALAEEHFHLAQVGDDIAALYVRFR